MLAALVLAAGVVALVLGPRRILDRLHRRLAASRPPAPVEERCAPGPVGLRLCIASDMAKLPDHGPVPYEAWLFDPPRRAIALEVGWRGWPGTAPRSIGCCAS